MLGENTSNVLKRSPNLVGQAQMWPNVSKLGRGMPRFARSGTELVEHAPDLVEPRPNWDETRPASIDARSDVGHNHPKVGRNQVSQRPFRSSSDKSKEQAGTDWTRNDHVVGRGAERGARCERPSGGPLAYANSCFGASGLAPRRRLGRHGLDAAGGPGRLRRPRAERRGASRSSHLGGGVNSGGASLGNGPPGARDPPRELAAKSGRSGSASLGEAWCQGPGSGPPAHRLPHEDRREAEAHIEHRGVCVASAQRGALPWPRGSWEA